MDSVAQQVLMGGVKSTPPGQQVFTAALTNWIVPAGVTSISVVTVGHGGPAGAMDGEVGGTGGGGGALAYVNNISVTPGETLNIEVGGYSRVYRSAASPLISAGASTGWMGGTVLTGTGGGGGNGSGGGGYHTGSCGGAGGYAGNGGNAPGYAGAGGGGGGGYVGYYKGGGVGLLGQGASGAAISAMGDGNPGSGGSGSTYGGGGSGPGAVRIIWPGNLRQFPSTRTTDE